MGGEEGGELGKCVDFGRVRKVYKINAGGGGGGGKKGGKEKGAVNGMASAEDERKEIEAVILGMMTIKGS